MLKEGTVKDVFPGDVVTMLEREAAPLLKLGRIERIKEVAAS